MIGFYVLTACAWKIKEEEKNEGKIWLEGNILRSPSKND